MRKTSDNDDLLAWDDIDKYREIVVLAVQESSSYWKNISMYEILDDAEKFYLVWFLHSIKVNYTGFPYLYDIFKIYQNQVIYDSDIFTFGVHKGYGVTPFKAAVNAIKDDIESNSYLFVKRGVKSFLFCDELYEIQNQKLHNYIEHSDFRPKQRWQIMERDGHKCMKCGRTAEDGIKLHVDHIFPKSRGGMATLENGQTLCNECNIGKGARVPLMQTVGASV